MSLDSILDAIPARQVSDRVTALDTARRHHVAQGGSSTAFYTAAADLLAYQRAEALEAGDTRTAEYIGELMIEFNLGIALDFAGRFRPHRGADLGEDYRAAATAGLWQAIVTYKPGRGSFSSWAYNSVRRAVTIAVRDSEYQTGTQGEFERRPRVIRAVNTLGADAPIEDIAALARVTVGAARRILEPAQLVPIDRQVKCRDGITFVDILPDDQDVEQEVIQQRQRETVQAYLEALLDTTSMEVIVRRYGLDGREPMGNPQVAELVGLSRERVRKIHEQALETLREAGLAEALTG